MQKIGIISRPEAHSTSCCTVGSTGLAMRTDTLFGSVPEGTTPCLRQTFSGTMDSTSRSMLSASGAAYRIRYRRRIASPNSSNVARP
jgi:hypothetical protein